MSKGKRSGLRVLFAPAISLMNRLKYTTKFLVLAVLAVISILVVVNSLYVSLQLVIRTSQHELQGMRLLPPVSNAIRLLQHHRGRVAAELGGDKTAMQALPVSDTDVSNALAVLRTSLPPNLASDPRIQSINSEWLRINRMGATISVDESFLAHTRIIRQLMQIMVAIADEYELTLDAAIDAYYLIDSVVNKLPMAAEHLGQIRAYGVAILASHSVSLDQKYEMRSLVGQLESTVEILSENLEKTARSNPGVRGQLTASLS